MVASLPVANGGGGGKGGCSSNACDPNARCGNGLEKIYPTCAVRFGYMRYLGEFRYAPGMLFGCGQKVVVQTGRGIEIGQQVSLTCSGCDKSVSREQILKYVKNSGPEFLQLKAGRILRAATDQDLSEDAHIQQQAARELIRAREIVAESGLDMKLVACEHLFGGERIVLHFMAEGRVDFRELVRTFAHEFNTRIEMHQVGARDEARLVADYEICGRECCCKNFLKKLRPVTMRMAKLQKATLDPSKVSGRCGRLRCCLRYEHEGYEVLDKKLPRNGNRMRTERGYCTVIDRQILTQLLHVRYDNGAMEIVPIESVLERDLPRNMGAPPQTAREAPGNGGAPSGGRLGGRDRGQDRGPNRSEPRGGAVGPPRNRDRGSTGGGQEPNDLRRPSDDAPPPRATEQPPPRELDRSDPPAGFASGIESPQDNGVDRLVSTDADNSDPAGHDAGDFPDGDMLDDPMTPGFDAADGTPDPGREGQAPGQADAESTEGSPPVRPSHHPGHRRGRRRRRGGGGRGGEPGGRHGGPADGGSGPGGRPG